MGLDAYSKTPLDNSTAVSPNPSEGWVGANVNNAIRQIMADVRADYERRDWISFTRDVAPRGAKTVLAGAGANEITIQNCDATAYLKAGQVIRVLQLGAETRLMLASDSTFVAGNTTVLTKTPRPAGPFDADGLEIFMRRHDVAPSFYFAGSGNTAARDAHIQGTTPLVLALWLNTDNAAQPMLQVGYGGAWANLAPLTVFTSHALLTLGAGLASVTTIDTTDPTKFVVTAFGVALEIRNDADLYFNGAKLTPGELDALTLGGLTLAQVTAAGYSRAHAIKSVQEPNSMVTTEFFVPELQITLPVPTDGVRWHRISAGIRVGWVAGLMNFRLRVRSGAGVTPGADTSLVSVPNAINGLAAGVQTNATAVADVWVKPPAGHTKISVSLEMTAGAGSTYFVAASSLLTTPPAADCFLSVEGPISATGV